MIDPKTLTKVTEILQYIQKARRLMEDVIDIEGTDWSAGMGPKPDRMRQAEQWRYDLVDMQDKIEQTYS